MPKSLEFDTPAVRQAKDYASDYKLSNHGLTQLDRVFWNLPEPALYEEAVFRGEAHMCHGGPLLVDTGKHTARAAADKIFQHNGPGTMRIENFWAEDFGKVYRSCGNCGTQYERHAILSNIIASRGDVIAGVNTNYGDTASFWNVTAGGATLCERYLGNSTGAQTQRTGSGIDGEYCIELSSAP